MPNPTNFLRQLISSHWLSLIVYCKNLESWNIRKKALADNLDRLIHLEKKLDEATRHKNELDNRQEEFLSAIDSHFRWAFDQRNRAYLLLCGTTEPEGFTSKVDESDPLESPKKWIELQGHILQEVDQINKSVEAAEAKLKADVAEGRSPEFKKAREQSAERMNQLEKQITELRQRTTETEDTLIKKTALSWQILTVFFVGAGVAFNAYSLSIETRETSQGKNDTPATKLINGDQGKPADSIKKKPPEQQVKTQPEEPNAKEPPAAEVAP